MGAIQSSEGTPRKKRSNPKSVVASTDEEKPLRIDNGYLSEKKPPDAVVKIVPKVFARRWIMVLLFATYSLSNAYQWIHLNIIGNIILKYYNESIPGTPYQKQVAVDWLSMVYMLSYIPLIIPATWLLDKKGLRIVGILGTLLNCLGAWLKCASVSPDRFFVLMGAQTVCAIAQVFILGIPAKLSSVWFGPNEVSTATAIGVFGNQLGCAIGFLIPPIIVPNDPDLAVIGDRLSYMFYGTAVITTILFILVLVVFKKAPPIHPSQAQAAILE
jgi:FLVCR family feline leukemia virus subgroup C receptor-related protein